MIRDFDSFNRTGLLVDLERLAEIWGGGGEDREETVEDRKTTDLPAVRD